MDLIEPPFELNQLTSSIIGAAIEVHRHLGPGYLEAVYEEAFVLELSLRAIVLERQVTIPIRYKGNPVGNSRLDLVVDGSVVVELKAVETIERVHVAQLQSYLKAGGFQLGLLINFNVPVLKEGIRRLISSG